MAAIPLVLEPPLDLNGRTETDDFEIREAGEHRGPFAATRPEVLRRIRHERVAAEEREPERLAVAVVEVSLCPVVPERSPAQPPEDERKRLVEPDRRVSAVEDDVADELDVGAVDDPAIAARRLVDARAELV